MAPAPRPARRAPTVLAAATAAALATGVATQCGNYGCSVDYFPEHPCQCNAQCAVHGNCCDDFHATCAATAASGGQAAAPASAALAAPGVPAAPAVLVAGGTTPPPPPRQVLYDQEPGAVLNFDMYRAMARPAVDTHPVEDDDMADLGGMMKYVHTEILLERLADPMRTARKYDIDVLTRHRYKIKNSMKLLKSSQQAMGEFGQFVTFDWGQATNAGQFSMFHDFGDFVGVQMGCGADMNCDVRWPSPVPYSWFSVGNWCPNKPWDEKGTKANPNPGCLKDTSGSVIKGGLCPNGFDAVNSVPTAEPTGDAGCVYTYGKASVVSLDELVGITAQDCAGGVKCRDWLHFRRNCTDPSLRRKFLPTGEITATDFCVEFDLHPHCDLCHSTECTALLKSGQEAYLGLPFWNGRCDPQANVRRTEQAAAAFGIPGALTNHIIVDPLLAESGNFCPRSKGTSWSCAPEIAGMSGPFCTRDFNGACQPCFVPGATLGADPSPKPYCPLDIFNKAPYTDREDFPLPGCKTTKASDGCCLYSGTCEGDSDPNRATLDDDGYALVASRRSSEDMEVFLRRAAVGNVAAQSASNEDAMRWAGYFGWEIGAVSRSLAQALEATANLAGEPLHFTPAASAQAVGAVAPVAPVAPASPAQPVAPQQPAAAAWVPLADSPGVKSGCFELAVSWLPLDMDGTSGVEASSPEACQEHCAKLRGCRHFSFLQSPGLSSGLCHAHGIAATVVLGSVGFASGPNICWDKLEDNSNMIDKGHKTFVSADLACMDWGRLYSPSLPGAVHLIAPEDGDDEQAILQCQRWCAANEQCTHFSINFPSRTCSLSGVGSSPMVSQMSAISGPQLCSRQDKQAFYRLFLDGVRRPVIGQPVGGGFFWLAAAAVLSLSGASVAALSVARARPFRLLSHGGPRAVLRPLYSLAMEEPEEESLLED